MIYHPVVSVIFCVSGVLGVLGVLCVLGVLKDFWFSL